MFRLRRLTVLPDSGVRDFDAFVDAFVADSTALASLRS
jgi:hypothetical protein